MEVQTNSDRGVPVFETIAFVSTIVFFSIGAGLFIINRQAEKEGEKKK